MFRKLLAVVKRHAATQRPGQVFQSLRYYLPCRVGLQVVGAADAGVSAPSLDQRDQRAATALADHRVCLPVAITATSVNDVRPAVDADAIGQFAASFRRSAATPQPDSPGRHAILDPV